MKKAILTSMLLVLMLVLGGFIYLDSRSSDQVKLAMQMAEQETNHINDLRKDINLTKGMAKGGDVDAMYILGDSLFYGHGIERSPQEGIDWMEKAGEKNDLSAQNALVEIYLLEENFHDYGKAFYWVKKMAEKGDSFSQVVLAKMYARGVGTEVNPDLALQWGEKASKCGDDLYKQVN